jgi:hypothetical protein
MVSWLAQNWADVVTKALVVVGAASLFVKTVAPLTKWAGDDKLAALLDKVLAFAAKLALNPKK